jgi:hypothetical protein
MTNVDINSGAIDGTIIGGASVAAGSFAAVVGTTITGSGILSIDDTTDTTSGITGSIHTDGGLGIAKKLFVGTTSTFTGNIVVTDGSVIINDTAAEVALEVVGSTTWTESAVRFDATTDKVIRFYCDGNQEIIGYQGGTLDIGVVTGAGAAGFDSTMHFTTGGMVLIGDTANTDMTVGLTINQGTNDDEAFAIKSSVITQPATNYAEAATYFDILKWSGTSGGAIVRGFGDADAVLGANALTLWAQAGDTTCDTTDTGSSTAPLELRSYKSDGGTSIAALATTENILAVFNAGATKMLIKGNGDMHITNTTLTALDEEDDVALIRAYQKASSGGTGVVMTEWDKEMKANEEDLRRVGVWSSESDFTIQQKMNSLLGGGIWQVNVMLKNAIKTLTARLEIAESKLQQLTA